MLGRVEDRIRRRGQRMDHDWQRRYYRRQQILQMQLGILEQNHSEGVRRRAHMMCRGMTDLSPDSGSVPGPDIQEEDEPEAEGGGEGESIDTYVYTTGTAMDDRMRQHIDEQDGFSLRAHYQAEVCKQIQHKQHKVTTRHQRVIKMMLMKRQHPRCDADIYNPVWMKLVILNIGSSCVILTANQSPVTTAIQVIEFNLNVVCMFVGVFCEPSEP